MLSKKKRKKRKIKKNKKKYKIKVIQNHFTLNEGIFGILALIPKPKPS